MGLPRRCSDLLGLVVRNNLSVKRSVAQNETAPVTGVMADNLRRFPVPRPLSACSSCGLREVCIPRGLAPAEVERLDSLIGASRRIALDGHLYRSGDPFAAVYMVKSGLFKTVVASADGHTYVAGFPMAGEILGIDGICGDYHTVDAVALEDSQVCVIPFAELEALSLESPRLQRHLHKLMSGEIIRNQAVMMLLGTLRAEARLAAFLLNLSQRLSARGLSPVELHLRMTREEIGSYLGVKLETVSRAFSKFQEDGLLTAQSREIRLLDLSGLKAAMGRDSRQQSRA